MIKFTAKQIEILAVLKNGNDKGEPCTVYQLIDRMSYTCKRDAMMHSIRILVREGLVERLTRIKTPSGSSHMTYGLTPLGLSII